MCIRDRLRTGILFSGRIRWQFVTGDGSRWRQYNNFKYVIFIFLTVKNQIPRRHRVRTNTNKTSIFRTQRRFFSLKSSLSNWTVNFRSSLTSLSSSLRNWTPSRFPYTNSQCCILSFHFCQCRKSRLMWSLAVFSSIDCKIFFASGRVTLVFL